MKLLKILTVLMMIFSGTQIFAEGERAELPDGCGAHINGSTLPADVNGGTTTERPADATIRGT